jgi:drug/metabolite transporter (DMT)-like permease
MTTATLTHPVMPFELQASLHSAAPTALAPATTTAPPATRLALGIAVGLLAASIGALYTVFARWGLARGLHAPDLTVLRYGVAGVVMLPVLGLAWWRDSSQFVQRWRLWLAVCLLAGVPFGLLMFGALQFAPASHAAVFPFSAMSIMGMLMSAWVLGDRTTLRRAVGIVIVLCGLVVLSGLDASSFTARGALGDAMFIAAGTLWAGFGILLRKNKLDPLLATAVISISALITYLPAYLIFSGGSSLLAASSSTFWVEVLVQGLIAGAGTLYTYAKMVSLLGPSRAAVFPALAPGLAALLAWPVLGHVPTGYEAGGLALAMLGLLIAVTAAARK